MSRKALKFLCFFIFWSFDLGHEQKQNGELQTGILTVKVNSWQTQPCFLKWFPILLIKRFKTSLQHEFLCWKILGNEKFNAMLLWLVKRADILKGVKQFRFCFMYNFEWPVNFLSQMHSNSWGIASDCNRTIWKCTTKFSKTLFQFFHCVEDFLRICHTGK